MILLKSIHVSANALSRPPLTASTSTSQSRCSWRWTSSSSWPQPSPYTGTGLPYVPYARFWLVNIICTCFWLVHPPQVQRVNKRGSVSQAGSDGPDEEAGFHGWVCKMINFYFSKLCLLDWLLLQFLYIKLFIVMGLLWLFDSLHFLLHGDHSQMDDCMTQVELMFRVLGCFNLSRGFFIFLIFVCKRSTLSKVCWYRYFYF